MRNAEFYSKWNPKQCHICLIVESWKAKEKVQKLLFFC